MKKIFNISIYCMLFLTCLNMNAQGYNYTLVHNGNYNFSIQIVPDASTSNFGTIVQAYNVAITMPVGVTGTATSVIGTTVTSNPFPGSVFGDPTVDGYLLTESLNPLVTIDAPSTGANTTILTFQLDQTPTSGTIEIVQNDSALQQGAQAQGFTLESVLTADTVDDGMTTFTNNISSPSGVTGTSSFDFSTLSVDSVKFLDFSVYPNPVYASNDTLNIVWPNSSQVMELSLVNIQGRIIKSIDKYSLTRGNNALKLKDMDAGVYFLNLSTDKQKLTKKIIIK